MPALDKAVNFAIVTVAQGYDAAATAIAVSPGEGSKLGVPPWNAFWWDDTTYPGAPYADPLREIIRCTAMNGDNLSTIVRGQEQSLKGLPASTKNTPGKIYKLAAGITAQMIADIEAKAVDIGAGTRYATEFGVKADGTTDDTAAMATAIAAASLLICPPGTYLLNGDLAPKSNLVIQGAGPGLTVFKLKNTASGITAVLKGTSISRFTLRDLTIDGNEANNTIGEGLRLDGATKVTLDNVEIKECRGACTAFGSSSGAVQELVLRHCVFAKSRVHLVEIQNRGSTNYGNLIQGCQFDTPAFNDAAAVKAAVSVRGPIRIVGCDFQNILNNSIGILLEDDDVTLGNGAHGSVISSCRMKGTAHATNVSIGVLNQAKRSKLSQVEVEGTDIGFQSDATQGDDANFSGCAAIGCADRSWKIGGDRNTLDGCHLEGTTTTGIEVLSGAIDTNLFFSRFVGTFTTKVSEAGTAEQVHARQNIGWKTESYVESPSDVAIDSAGFKSSTIAHGLDVTPTKAQCNISQHFTSADPTTGAGYGAVRGPYISHTSPPDATNVVVKIEVITAAVTGTTIRFGVHLNTRP